MTGTYSCNSVGLPVNIEYFDNGTKKEGYGLTFDKRGYIIKEDICRNYDTAKNLTKEYDYDEIGRLLTIKNTADVKVTTTSYTYDRVGNRLTMSNGTDSFAYNYNQFNNLLEVKKNGQIETTFQYDVNGNQIKEVSKKDVNGTIRDITTDYVYDRADRLTNISISDGLITKKISNYYNGDGQRTRQDDNEYITKYFYDDGNLLFTADVNNAKATENILDPYGVIVASKRFDGNYANMYFFYNYDARGSVTSIVNPEGSLVKGYEYDEFGQTKETGDSQFKNNVKFTGAVHDQSANLYYMNSRFYNPSTGRFLTQDSYSGSAYVPWTQHLYTYTGNNPVNYVDPTGHIATRPSIANLEGDLSKKQSTRTSTVSNNNISDTTLVKSKSKWQEFKDWAGKTEPTIPFYIPSSGEIISELLAAGSATLISAAEKMDKKIFGYIGSDMVIKFLPTPNELRSARFKNVGKFGTALTTASNTLDLLNTWSEDNGNTNGKRLEKSAIQIGGAVTAGTFGALVTGPIITAGTASIPETGILGVGIVVLGGALDYGISWSIGKAQEALYNYLKIK